MTAAIFASKRAARLAASALAAFALSGAAFTLWQMPAAAAGDAVAVPPPSLDEKPAHAGSETAVFAGGCFWGVQGVFQHVRGVENAVSGYAGGARADAEYETVSTGTTGHAESVEITYDPAKITYGKLLQVYFSVAHNPTELNYQGPDRGTQYRSTIFAANDTQKKIAQAYIAQLGKDRVFAAPIVTTLEEGRTFYPAESYHQDFLERNPTYPYIVYNDLPKIEALKRMFPDLYSEKPVLVMAQAKG
ncbi:peptide-methionine (S)-S-oxide reductase MsrA [Mesorhizobium sp. PUT5]|uniref:peptide-methionine (S)-S-oxide reductase MsrA n=1 Tax=Mesorhizobium sp. PUT5 TaxID=3454629 RepID=UPI003FA42246